MVTPLPAWVRDELDRVAALEAVRRLFRASPNALMSPHEWRQALLTVYAQIPPAVLARMSRSA